MPQRLLCKKAREAKDAGRCTVFCALISFIGCLVAGWHFLGGSQCYRCSNPGLGGLLIGHAFAILLPSIFVARDLQHKCDRIMQLTQGSIQAI